VSDKYTRRRLQSSSLTTIVSISLVLFMLGLVGLLLLNAKKLSDHVKENINIQVIFKDNAKEVDITKLRKTLDAADFVRTTEFISKDEAATRWQEETGEDFLQFLDFNPLLPSINIYLKADYANPDSLLWIEKDLMASNQVKEVVFHKPMIDTLNNNVNKITLVILIFSGLLMVIALGLINNTIRLSIYSKRFIIRTMQLVGATHGFIRRPFIWKGIRHGVFAALIAIALLMGFMYFMIRWMPEIKKLQDEQLLLTLFGIVILLGVLISWISTYFAVRKYLRLKTDELYY
jgi:cell division transport system permease protein